jgi:hypothetical protein
MYEYYTADICGNYWSVILTSPDILSVIDMLDKDDRTSVYVFIITNANISTADELYSLLTFIGDDASRLKGQLEAYRLKRIHGEGSKESLLMINEWIDILNMEHDQRKHKQ